MIRLLALFLAAALLSATACHRTNKAEQLAALDSAYQSGLLTKDEYDAKRLALAAATPAPAVAQIPVPAATQVPAQVQNPAPAAAPPAKEARPAAQPPRAPAPSVASSVAPSSPPPPPPAAAPTGNRQLRPGVGDAKEPEPAPLAGCDDAEYKSGGQKGAEERFFAAPPEAVRRAAVSALGSLDFNIRKNSKTEIEASKKRHIGVVVGAGGERVTLTFQNFKRGGQSGTRVIGETKKSFVGRMAQRTWTDAVLAQIACKLHESSR